MYTLLLFIVNTLYRCKCGNCAIMATIPECVCCSEIERVVDKMEENTVQIKCITDHEGFSSVCLNMWVLQTAFHQYRQSHGSQIPTVNYQVFSFISTGFCFVHRKYRFMGYRQLTWWCWDTDNSHGGVGAGWVKKSEFLYRSSENSTNISSHS